MIASKKGGPGDRIVLDGYTPFLIDRLKEGTEIRYNQSVCGVSKGVKPVDPAVDLAAAEQALGAGQKRTPSEEAQIAWNSDPETATRTVYVATRGGEMHQGDFVVITIPLGVLQREHDESSVTFSPPLSEEKLEAIRGMGMGVHNKIVLRFREDDVFWPPKIPQLNCLDPRFQFFNLHSYGKPGVLLVHVFAESGFANGYWGLSDEGTVAEVLMVLGGMFCPPIEASNEGATSGSNTQSPSAAKPALARRRIAKMLNICDNCRRPLDSSDPDITTTEKSAESTKCKACGSVMVREDEGEEHFQKLTIDPMQANQQPAKDASNAEAKADAEEELILAPKRVTWQTFPAPEEYIVTRWEEDPFALGSYSYMPCGSTWTMIDQIAAPEPRDSAHPYLFFAGEHCSDMGWQCVHGAYETGIRAAREIMTCLNGGVLPDILEEPPKDAPKPPSPPRSAPQPSLGTDPFWTAERERALTRALIGYSDVYGNINDVIDEIAHALETFKKEPTDLPRGEIRSLVQRRIQERAEEEDIEAKAFLRFHNSESSSQEESFPKPFHEINDRDRLIGLNGSKLRELYAADIIRELKDFAKPVAENQVSYREALRKIAVMIYKKDGGLMTKRCLSEYLRTQEFGTGPQKELYLAKYLPQK